MKYRETVYALLFLLVFTTVDLFGCPVCDTETGQQVRAGIFNGSFGKTFLSVVAPFPILLAVLAAIHWWPKSE